MFGFPLFDRKALPGWGAPVKTLSGWFELNRAARACYYKDIMMQVNAK
jgi:hypothetical protein